MPVIFWCPLVHDVRTFFEKPSKEALIVQENLEKLNRVQNGVEDDDSAIQYIFD